MAQEGEDQADSTEGCSQAGLVERLEVGIRGAYQSGQACSGRSLEVGWDAGRLDQGGVCRTQTRFGVWGKCVKGKIRRTRRLDPREGSVNMVVLRG